MASPQDIIEFIFFPVVNEGCRVIAEGIVDKPADLDVATVMAMGFPAYRYTAFRSREWSLRSGVGSGPCGHAWQTCWSHTCQAPNQSHNCLACWTLATEAHGASVLDLRDASPEP